MEAKLRLTVAGGEAIDLVLKGPARAIEELIDRLPRCCG